MESNEERGCLIGLIFGLLVAFLVSWFINYQGLRHAALSFFVVLFFLGVVFWTIRLAKNSLTGLTKWKVDWFSICVFLIPSIALLAYSIFQINGCFQDKGGDGAAGWLFASMLSFCGISKFLNDSEDC